MAQQRRRGAELERALLDAAWAELSERGFGRFTMEAVAARAGTSTPVLYRRWPDRRDLALAAIQHWSGSSPAPAMPDTGSLRGDLVAMLTSASERRAEFAALFSLRMADFFDETGDTPARLRERVLGDYSGVEDFWARAVRRGEVDPAVLTPRVKGLPFDLLRHELMMTLAPVPRATVEEIVDEVVLPVLTRKT